MQEIGVVDDATAPCPILRYGPYLGLYLYDKALLKGPAVETLPDLGYGLMCVELCLSTFSSHLARYPADSLISYSMDIMASELADEADGCETVGKLLTVSLACR